VFASDDAVFAWAIGKAALVVIVCVSTLVYAAWAVTYQRKNAMDVGIPRDSALRRKGSVKADKVVFIANGTAEEAWVFPAGDLDDLLCLDHVDNLGPYRIRSADRPSYPIRMTSIMGREGGAVSGLTNESSARSAERLSAELRSSTEL
jgi:hypothetical protein